ncbi:hypothetical protein D6774_01405 [Candidatus Woesearchaeota archaeon]|jgi:hypothetical protein|nr:MAG: hypothetical protein D6774_01405 [Candidatus Woesearchaeota archaeon]
MDNYVELQSQYGLPSYEDLDHYFEITSIEEGVFLRQVRKKIAEKFEGIATHLQDILNPDASPSSMGESSFFDDNQKERIYSLFKSLMVFIRKSSLLSIEDSDELNAQYINEAFSFFIEHKEEFKQIFEHIQTSWKQDLNKSERIHYLG